MNLLTRRAVRRYRQAFLRTERRDAVAVATHLRDSLPFLDGNAPVITSGIHPSAELPPDNDAVRLAVAALGGAEFWVEDNREHEQVIHSVYVVTMSRSAYLTKAGER